MIGKSSRQAWLFLTTVVAILFLGCIGDGCQDFKRGVKGGMKAAENIRPVTPSPVPPPRQGDGVGHKERENRVNEYGR